MNINLGSLFVNNESEKMQQMQQMQQGGTEIKDVPSEVKIADIRNLPVGQLFEGDVYDINNLQVRILLDGNTILNATMNEAVNLNIGDHVVFQVKENTDSKILIRPFQMGNDNQLILKALNNSGITVNDKNVSVVKELMAQGQPLDKQTITDIIRLSNRFPQAELQGIVELKKHGIPVTADNLSMYKAYSEGDAGISESFKNISNELPSVMESAFSGAGSREVMAFVTDILDIIMPEESYSDGSMKGNTVSPDGGQAVVQGENSAAVDNLSDMPQSTEVISKNDIHLPEINNQPDNSASADNAAVINKSIDVSENISYYSMDNTVKMQNIESGTVSNAEHMQNNAEESNNTDNSDIISSNTRENITEGSSAGNNVINNNAVAGEGLHDKLIYLFNNALMSGQAKGTDDNIKILTRGKNAMEDKVSSAIKRFGEMALNVENDRDIQSVKSEILEIFKDAKPSERIMMAQSEPFRKLIHKAVEKNLFIKPDNISNSPNPKEDVERIYERVRQQLEKLTDVVKDATGKGIVNEHDTSSLMNNVKTAGQNLNFMNDLNHMSSYVQIPVKFSGQESEGELYVYNKNVKKTVEEGISAFLHFDLENLGVTDIRIHLRNKGLRLGFEINDEISVRLVEEHIGELADRLTKKGYSVNYNVEMKQKEEHNTLKEIFERDERQISIKRYTLDIRT